MAIAQQKIEVESGNELAAIAASQINYHIMGYFPITPSTQIAEHLDFLKTEGYNQVKMIPGDGEHGAAGICYGASLGGGRVINATSANGLLYAIEQLPVQSGTRFPMVLNLVTRAVSGPLDIKCDHSDLAMTLNTGWLILYAKDPQAVYDLNILALKIAEHEKVRLPIIIASDGFFVSHQKRRVQIFENPKDVQNFLGECKTVYTAIDVNNPVTIGPYMNEPDLINNKKQLADAMENAYDVILDVFKQFKEFSGREYNLLNIYKMEDAEVAIFVTGSPYDTCCEVADALRKQGKKVGVVGLVSIRPFPIKDIQKVFKNTKVIISLDRQDSLNEMGGNFSTELRSALQMDGNLCKVISKIYGIGGKEFYYKDAEVLFNEGLEILNSNKVKEYNSFFGITEGKSGYTPKRVLKPLTKEEQTAGITCEMVDGKLQVKVPPLRQLMKKQKRLVSGHGACPGCGIFASLNQFLLGIEGHVVIQFHTGCAMVVTTGYPTTSHRVTYIHNLFQNGAATLSGLVEMFEEKKRRGEIPKDEEITFIMVTGDGGLDIGMGPAIGAANRNHKMILLEYDNEGYMNTGNQLSYATPLGHATSTSHAGPYQKGKTFHHKDSPQIMAAAHIPYVFTACEANTMDLIRKARKAQWYAQNEGFAFGKLLSVCPLNWRTVEKDAKAILEAAINCNFFPLYEIEHGITTITYDPESKNKKISLNEWLKMMGKTKHLLKEEEIIRKSEEEIERRWRRLKAMHESPYL